MKTELFTKTGTLEEIEKFLLKLVQFPNKLYSSKEEFYDALQMMLSIERPVEVNGMLNLTYTREMHLSLLDMAMVNNSVA